MAISFQPNNGTAYRPITELSNYQGKNLRHIDLIFKTLVEVNTDIFSGLIPQDKRLVLSLDRNVQGIVIKEFCVQTVDIPNHPLAFVSYIASMDGSLTGKNELVGVEIVGSLVRVDKETGYDSRFYFTKENAGIETVEATIIGFRNIAVQ